MSLLDLAGTSREGLVEWLRSNAPHTSVGLLAADAMAYGKAIDDLEKANIKLLHFDVMDGVFCPQMTAGPALVKAIETSMLKDVHLMVADPLRHIPAVIASGADIVHVHPEGQIHVRRALVELDVAVAGHEHGRKIIRSLALNPGTPVEVVRPLLPHLEMITLVAVDPGWGGGGPDDALRDKIDALRVFTRALGFDPLICIDGGITPQTYLRAALLKPDIIVSGSAVFKGAGNVVQNLEALTST